MKPEYHYAPVAEALDDLKEKGYTYDFNLHEEDIKKNPEHYKVEQVFRYEGDTDPDEESVVYGIISNLGEKGVFVSGFSANSDNEAAITLNQLCLKD
jgi:hypothetical protein